MQIARVDGHDIDAVSAAVEVAKKSRKPSLIACKTTIGFGAPNLLGVIKRMVRPWVRKRFKQHAMPLGGHMVRLRSLQISDLWESIASRGQSTRHEWQSRLDVSPKKLRFERTISGEVPKALVRGCADMKGIEGRITEGRKPSSVTNGLGGDQRCGAFNGWRLSRFDRI